MQVTGIKPYFVSMGFDRALDISKIRHATEEEIKREKERLLWKSIGRAAGKFKDGDLGATYLGSSYVKSEQLTRMYAEGRLEGFYPEGSFVQFDTEEKQLYED